MSQARPELFQTSRRHHRIVLVIGPSGSGRTTAIAAMEDLGFETISNLPLSLLPRLLEGPPPERPLAFGLGLRNRDFSINALIELIDQLNQLATVQVDVLYLECRDEVLARRYSETRRRHPMAPADGPDAGIAREQDLLGPVRARADILIDTSDMTPHELKEEIRRWFDTEGDTRLAVSVQSFSYKRGIPRAVDVVIDCRFLRNPYWDEKLRPADGRDPGVVAYVEADPRFEEFFARLHDLAEFLLPAYLAEGKAHLAIAFGCTGGQHRSVVIAERLANALAAEGWQVSTRHRELERRGAATPAMGPATAPGTGAVR